VFLHGALQRQVEMGMVVTGDERAFLAVISALHKAQTCRPLCGYLCTTKITSTPGVNHLQAAFEAWARGNGDETWRRSAPGGRIYDVVMECMDLAPVVSNGDWGQYKCWPQRYASLVTNVCPGRCDQLCRSGIHRPDVGPT